MFRKKIVGVVLGTLLLGGGVAQARNNAALFGVAAAVIGAAAIANHNSRANAQPRYREAPRSHRNTRHHKKRYTKKKTGKAKVAAKKKTNRVKVVTNDMRVQKSLYKLGFYDGKANGDLNSFSTRSAIKKMNVAYGISEDSSMEQKTKDQLIYMSHLYEMNKYMYAEGTKKSIRGKRLQAALKVHDTYHGKIDGAVGKGTNKAIRHYKENNGMYPDKSLTSNQRYALVGSAIEMNNKNIENAISALRIDKEKPVVVENIGLASSRESIKAITPDESTKTIAEAKKEVGGTSTDSTVMIASSSESTPLQTVSSSASSYENEVAKPISANEADEDDFAMPDTE